MKVCLNLKHLGKRFKCKSKCFVPNYEIEQAEVCNYYPEQCWKEDCRVAFPNHIHYERVGGEVCESV